LQKQKPRREAGLRETIARFDLAALLSALAALLATLIALLAAALSGLLLLLLTRVLAAATLLTGLVALLILLTLLLVFLILILILRHLGFPLHKKEASPLWDTFARCKRHNCAVRSDRGDLESECPHGPRPSDFLDSDPGTRCRNPKALLRL
jgi:hypothetical protein